MSIVIDQVRRLDSYLDRIQLMPDAVHDELLDQSLIAPSSSRITQLKRLVKELSTTSSSPISDSSRILTILQQANFPDLYFDEDVESDLVGRYEKELHWLLISKATVQIYGLLLEALLEQAIILNNHSRYWDIVLGSYTNSSLFALQTSPLRLWSWSKEIYHDLRKRLERIEESSESIAPVKIRLKFLGQWEQFYYQVRKSIQRESLKGLQKSILSPIALCRTEARHNQLRLKRLREMGASGLGILIVEGLIFDNKDDDPDVLNKDNSNDWKIVVERSIALMDIVLNNILSLEMGILEFEDIVFASVGNDFDVSNTGDDEPQIAQSAKLSKRLQHILRVLVPNHNVLSRKQIRRYGQPSRCTRFWLPTCVALFSSTTILNLIFSRKKVITKCIQNFGATVRDFCMNWLLEPIKKVFNTIRHDPDSELALLSKQSLSGDRDSLERMVVDFAIDNSCSTGLNPPLTEAQIYEIRTKVREGDLTPVLRAYEKELRSPLRGTIRGDLVRTLLIQIQKTKVDVEIALSGIDALLKSQELVFGFVGLTPGVVICFTLFQYLGGLIGNMRGLKIGHEAGQMNRILRNIDRILTLATPIQDNLLSYKDHGLLLCEVHILRKHVTRLFPSDVAREFLEDIAALCDVNRGLRAQSKALKRIKWAYAERL